jgi:uncharacterized protein YdeI (YjbR/CyaY-like superfamily)
MSQLIHKELPVYSFPSKDAFYAWLGMHHTLDQGFWLRYYKKGTDIPSIKHTDAVDVALCWGWIDGLINRYDEQSYLVRFTKRKSKSVWSQVNRANVERLIASGEMQPQGLAHVTAAKSDGRWDAAYAGQSTMDVPDHFKQLLAENPEAETFYANLSKANKYAIAFRIATAVGAEKQNRVMESMLQMLLERRTFHE